MAKREPNQVEIYALCDASGAIRYVGKATCSSKRLSTHIRDSRRRHTPVCCWVKKLCAQGMLPQVKVIETCDEQDWPDRERAHIARLRAEGANLLNLADGGDQPSMTREQRSSNAKTLNSRMANDPKLARKRMLMSRLATALRLGQVSEEQKARFRSRPDVFGGLAKWL